MPKNIKNPRIASGTRMRAVGRKNKEKHGCQGSDRTSESAPAIIANSLFTVSLKPKPGIEVITKKTQKESAYRGDDDYVAMYNDLLKCFQNALLVVKGEVTTCDFLKEGLDIGVSMTVVLNGFKNNILPEGYEYNIDRDDEHGYYFTIYKECRFHGYWHAFEIKPIIVHLRRYNKKLHDLFIVFIKSFMDCTGIMSWWGGGMGFADYMVEQEVHYWDDNHEIFDEYDDSEEAVDGRKQRAFAEETLKSYTSGEVRSYQDKITKAKFRTPASLLKSLERFPAKNPIVKWMKEACLFMQQPGNLDDFIYQKFEEENNDELGLKFDQQAAIIWDWDDYYTSVQEECIEAETQGIGICEPMINMAVMKHSKIIDLDDLKIRSEWPVKLSVLFDSQRDLINNILKKKKK